MVNSVDHDQMLHFAASDLSLQFAQACLGIQYFLIYDFSGGKQFRTAIKRLVCYLLNYP